MAIKISGVNAIDDNRNVNAGIVTATSLDVPPQTLTFSPTDAASGVLVDSNIVITFNVPVTAGTGNILLNKGSAGGATHETIDVTSGNVSISGSQVTINPSSNLPTGNDIYVVVPADAFTSTGTNSGSELINTYNFSTGPILVSSLSPADGATNVDNETNIVITFSENIAKGSGNITLRAGSASGTVRQTIDVTSGAVSVSGTQATINPPSDLEYLEDTYVVVDAGCFRNSDGDAASGNAIINTYNFTTESELLGSSQYGGNVICASSNVYWISAPASSEVTRNWYDRNDAVTRAQQVSSCSGWFIPNINSLQNPGYTCRTYWESHSYSRYFSDTERPGDARYACIVNFDSGSSTFTFKSTTSCIRAFRCVSY